MPKVTYIGPFDEVDLPAIGQAVKRGQAVEVPAATARALAAQGDSWKAAGSKKPRKKAAAKKAAASPQPPADLAGDDPQED